MSGNLDDSKVLFPFMFGFVSELWKSIFPIELRCLHLIDLNDGSEDIDKISGVSIFIV